MIQAFRELGHEVEEVALVDTETGADDAARDAGDASWKKLAKSIPFAYDLLQLLYNLMGIPLLAARRFLIDASVATNWRPHRPPSPMSTRRTIMPD